MCENELIVIDDDGNETSKHVPRPLPTDKSDTERV